MLIQYAIIADIVGSRALPDRAQAQQTFIDVLTRAGEGLDLPRSPYATVGDEFQAVAGMKVMPKPMNACVLWTNSSPNSTAYSVAKRR